MTAVAKIPECLNKSQCREIIIDGQVPVQWALPLYGYAMPIIVAITLATNSFIVVVLSRRHLRTPTNIVLLAMAVTEMLTGLACLPWLLYYYTFDGYKADRQIGLPAFWCTMFPYMASILPSIFHTAAIWLTVYLAVQRYIYICLPKLVTNHCTIQRSKQVIAIICIASIWIYAPELFATYNQSYEYYNIQSNKTRRACLRVRTVFIDFLGNDIYYYGIYGLHTLLSHTFPCILLVCFTWKLIKTMRVADQRYAQLIANRSVSLKYVNNVKKNFRIPTRKFTSPDLLNAVTSAEFTAEASNNIGSCNESLKDQTTNFAKRRASTAESKRVQGLKQNTRMLITVILLFLVTEIPAALIFLLHISTIALRITFIQKHYAILNKLLIVRNVLIVVTYPFRFAIYCGMSQQFRECVRKMILQHKFLSNRRRFMSSAEIQSTRFDIDSTQMDPLITRRCSANNSYSNNNHVSTVKTQPPRNDSSRSSSADTILTASAGKDLLNKLYLNNDIMTANNNIKPNIYFENKIVSCTKDGDCYAIRRKNKGTEEITVQIEDSGCGNDSEMEDDAEYKFTKNGLLPTTIEGNHKLAYDNNLSANGNDTQILL